jgi:acyl-CoA thioesterase I
MSFIFALAQPSPSWIGARSYGAGQHLSQIARAALCSALLAAASASFVRAETPVKIVALGDSLTAGLGLPEHEGFVPRLQAALAARGVSAEITNAGVSGDTASDGLARLDWSVPPGTDAVIVELGANDMLRGIDPQVTRRALATIVQRLQARHITILLCGMLAAPNLGADYRKAFDRIYPALAEEYGVPLYPFFLAGVASDPRLNQSDGLHPNEAGVRVIVARIVPAISALIARVRLLHK